MGLSDINIIIGADLSRFNTAMQNLSKNLDRIGQELQTMGRTISMSVTLPLVALAGVSLKAAGDMQALKKGLEAVTGSAEEAEKEFQRLKEVAKLPGLGLTEAVQMSVLLQATGFSAQQARNSIMQFGNALALVGRGREDLSGVLVQLSQMASKSKVVAGDLKPIMERTPQIATIIKKAFGTIDTEEIQKMGVSTTEMINVIMRGLEQLPRATGGINNAFENAKDAVTQALAGIGEALNKTFNIEGLINTMTEKLIAMVDAFNNLSPAMQKTIFIVAGIAAVVGPAILALGLMASAIAAISLPVVLVVATVAGAVALIVMYWDEIVAYFSSGPGGKIFDQLAETAGITFDTLSNIVKTSVDVILLYWNRLGSGIMEKIYSAFKFVLSTVNYVMGMLNNTINVFKGVFTGNWQLVWDSIKNIFKLSVNQLINIVTFLLSSVLDTFAQAAGVFGADEIQQKILGVKKTINEFTDSIKFNVAQTNEATKAFEGLKGAIGGIPKPDLGSITSSTTTGDFDRKAKATTYKSGDKTRDDRFTVATAAQADTPFSAMIPQLQAAKLAYSDFANKMVSINQQISQAFKQAAVDAIAATAEMIGSAIAGGNGLQQLPKMLLQTLGSLMSQIGKAAIGIGISMLAIKKSFTNPVAAIGAGVALLVAAGALGAIVSNMNSSGSTPKFADGGIVYGPTMGLMGEYSGASNNPEVIAPLSDLKGMLGNDGGGGMGTVTFEISGTNLIGILRRQQAREGRVS